MWTDVLAPFRSQGKPEVVAKLVRQAAHVLPHEVVGVDWNYGGTHFYVAPQLKAIGLEAFTAPAARAYGDVFDLPRVQSRMENIREAFLRAVQWKLAGTILTSWSYRASPHEVCLPEYAAAAYGWNTHEADIGALLPRFFSQRYGLSRSTGAALAQSACAETRQTVPTAVAIPTFDVERRVWTISAAGQATQLITRIGEEGATKLPTELESQLRLCAANNVRWQSALQSAQRHQRELRCWDLSRRHLQHRLALSLSLVRLKSGGDEQSQLDSLAKARTSLRSQWKELYRGVFTPAAMNVELETRFDDEPGIVDGVRRWQRD
jgi:hypothetical protein